MVKLKTRKTGLWVFQLNPKYPFAPWGCLDSGEIINDNAADPGHMGSKIFFLNSNLDLWYLCSPLTKINV